MKLRPALFRHGRGSPLLTVAGLLALMAMGPGIARAEPDGAAAGPPAPVILLRVATQDTGVGVDRVLPNGTRQPVCTAPCSQRVDRRDIFVVNEDGVPRSPALSLPETDSEVSLTVRRGSTGMRRTGEALIAAGAAAQLVGFMFSGGDPAPAQMSGMPAARAQDHRGTFLAVGLGGIVLAAAGLLLFLRGRDRVDSSTGNSFVLSD